MRASPSHIVHAPPNAPQAKSTEFKCTYIYTRIQMRLIRIRARADSRCDGAALTFYLSALMAFPFLQGSSFFFFFFSRKLKERTRCASHNRVHPLRLQLGRHRVPYTVLDSYLRLRYFAYFTIVHLTPLRKYIGDI